MARRTKADLEQDYQRAARSSAVYAEVARALLHGERPTAWHTADDRWTIFTLALGRACGGVCAMVEATENPADAIVWQYVMDWSADRGVQADPYLGEVLRSIQREAARIAVINDEIRRKAIYTEAMARS